MGATAQGRGHGGATSGSICPQGCRAYRGDVFLLLRCLWGGMRKMCPRHCAGQGIAGCRHPRACGKCMPLSLAGRASPDAAVPAGMRGLWDVVPYCGVYRGGMRKMCPPSLHWAGHCRMPRCLRACGAYHGMPALLPRCLSLAACGRRVPPSLPGRASPDAAVAVGMRDLSRDAGTVAAEPACGRHVLLPLRWAGHPRQPPLLQMGIKCPLWGMPYCARPCIGLFAFRAACARPRTGVPPSLPALPKARPCGGMAASYCQQDRFPAPLHPLAVQWQANTLLRPAGNLNPAATKKATL